MDHIRLHADCRPSVQIYLDILAECVQLLFIKYNDFPQNMIRKLHIGAFLFHILNC